MVYSDIELIGMSDGMFMRATRIVSILALAGVLATGCAQIKEAGRTVGHTTRDVAREIGHGARNVTREIGHGTRDVVNDVGDGIRDTTKSASDEVKKTVKPGSSASEY